MGALLVDAVLQAGLNYRTVVVPRVNRVLQQFPNAVTTLAFKDVLDQSGAANVLQWAHPEKPRRLCELTVFLIDNAVFTTTAFRAWLLTDTSSTHLAGIGPKTIDYLKMLCGIDSIAVDRHIQTFVSRAGVRCSDYDVVKQIVERAADVLGVARSELDRAIWDYESNNSATRGCRGAKN
jgi:hypothetical protein